MNEKRIKAYCKKPDCFLKRIGIHKYNFYNPYEIENIVSKMGEDFTELESKLRKEDVVIESQTDIFKKEVMTGAVIRTRDYAVSIHLAWYELDRIDAEILFDKDYKHSDDEYKRLTGILKHYHFHILKPKD